MENILALGRRRRLLNGIILSVATLALAVALVLLSAGPAWFTLVFVLAFLAAVMLLQARERT
jgi:uncharacterized membrane protein